MILIDALNPFCCSSGNPDDTTKSDIPLNGGISHAIETVGAIQSKQICSPTTKVVLLSPLIRILKPT